MEKMKSPTQEAKVMSMLNSIESRRPTLSRVLDRFGKNTLNEYSETFAQNETEPIQPREEVAVVARNHAERLLGSEIAKKVEKRLIEKPVLLTANHHGPDFLNITLQSDIIFSLGENPDGVVPVLAGGIVPLNNLSYGRGVLLSREQQNPDIPTRTIPVKISLFPKSENERMVSFTPPFSEKQVNDAISETDSLHQKKVIGDEERKMLRWTLRQDFRDPEVLRQESFSDQSTIINNRLWKRYFAKEVRDDVPEMAYLEMETIVSDLLQNDLENPDSFVYQLMFNRDLRKNASETLNGVYGCWDNEKLRALNDKSIKGNDRRKLLQGAGTAFFAGVDAKGRRVALELLDEENNPKLSGVDDSGNDFEMNFNPESVKTGLKEGKIIPSIFTSYAELAFAHGYKCYGGFMQTDYLTNMRQGLVQALENVGNDEWAGKVASVPTENYTAGMTFAVAKYNDGSIKPAGGIEIMTKGGLTKEDVQKIKSLQVTNANLIGLPGMYPVVFRESERDQELQDVTPESIHKMLGTKMVEIEV